MQSSSGPLTTNWQVVQQEKTDNFTDILGFKSLPLHSHVYNGRKTINFYMVMFLWLKKEI